MGLGDEAEPPKKKLKQAQLCFTPKSQKRKLVSDLDDECQIVKIVCKETGINGNNVNVNDKENQLSVNATLSSEKKLKHDLEPCILPTVENSTKTSKLSSGNGIDIVEENACMTSTDEKEGERKTDSDTPNNSEFSLSISDSVIDTINQKSLPNEDQDQLENVTLINDNSEKQPVTVKVGSGEKEESLSDSEKNIGSTTLSESNEDESNKTLNSEDDVVSLSSSHEESPERKPSSSSSPSVQGKTLTTPKRLEAAKKKEERKLLILEKKAQRARIKEEKIRQQEEEKRKKKEEKELKRQAEQKLKEEEKRAKEEERKKRDEEKKQKEEERKKKEEGRRLKEEEKRKREEAREEEKRKKEEIEEKKKAAFAKFFKKSKLPDVTDQKNDEDNFMPFPMKPDMKLANEPRRLLTSEQKEALDRYLTAEVVEATCSYLSDIKSGDHVPLKSEETWPLSSIQEEHDVIIIESTETGDCVDLTNANEERERNRTKAKLFQFHDNRRPPYWGTWRKTSKSVRPRKPFALDKDLFDYEVDSDSEWEDEGEGEDIEEEKEEGGGESEGEQSDEEDAEAENGYVLDNTFVPHGYLSDEEVHPDEDAEDNFRRPSSGARGVGTELAETITKLGSYHLAPWAPDDDSSTADAVNQSLRMTLLKEEFDEEMKTKTERLKPRLLGCVWISNGTTEISSGSLYEGLMTYRAVWNEDEGSIDVSGPVVEDSPSTTVQTRKPFPQTVIPILAKFVHGSYFPMSALVKEFLLLIEKEHPSEHVSKRAVSLKIKEIATKTNDYSVGKSVWAVNGALCDEHGLKPLLNNIPAPPPIPPAPPVVEKPKDGPLMNFLKGVQTPPVKKKVPFITLPSSSFDYTPSKLIDGGVKNFGTPRPVDPVLKKRAQLITLSRSINKNKEEEALSSEGAEKLEVKPVECIDLCEDSK